MEINKKLSELENNVNYTNNVLINLTDEFNNELLKFPHEEIFKKYGIDTSKEEDLRIVNLCKNNNDKYKELSEELKKYPEFKEAIEILNKRDIAKISFSVAL